MLTSAISAWRKVVEMSMDLTRSGNLVGTPAYVAPELVRGEIVTPSSDIYSLGVILYHMLSVTSAVRAV